jgi:hypothetical protein
VRLLESAKRAKEELEWNMDNPSHTVTAARVLAEAAARRVSHLESKMNTAREVVKEARAALSVLLKSNPCSEVSSLQKLPSNGCECMIVFKQLNFSPT